MARRCPVEHALLLIQRHQPRKEQLRLVLVHGKVDQRRIQRRQVTGIGADLQWAEDLLGVRQLGIRRGLGKGPGGRAPCEQD